MNAAWKEKQRIWPPLALICLAAAFALVQSGCATRAMPAAFVYDGPPKVRVDRKAWVAQAEVTDTKVEDREAFELAVSLEIVKYLKQKGYFREVDVLSRERGEDDLTLRFRFSRFRQTLGFVHPAAIPGLLATVTLYALFGGPIIRDTCDLEGTLEIEDSRGARIAEIRHSVEESDNFNLYKPHDPAGLNTDFVDARSRFIREVVEKALMGLNGSWRRIE